jgi:ribose transport system substrate-binding protein
MSVTVDQFASRQAVFGIEAALKAIAGKSPQASLPKVTSTDVALVTR